NVDVTDTWGGEAASGDLGGITVSLRTSADERWYFAHLDRVASGIEEGLEVTAGQPLGYVGDSGNARGTPPHLHLSRFVGDIAANPYHALAVACADG
ncbi:MAG TPA: M23 family metallopeptidase, partial [Nitriliruptorales bacterium]|nr:M23 family metallopeptidase [Nitriliruptorales bacterium]